MKQGIMDKVAVLLLRHGFTIRSLSGSCFDIVARKGPQVLLVKALEDANSLSEDYAVSMRNLGSYIGASPVVVAEKAGRMLEDGVVYSRFGVYACNYSTFGGCLENRFPVVISTKAGVTASVIGERLRRQREESGFSLGALSRKVGVSRRMIVKYESNDADVSLRSAIALNRLFGSGIFNKVNVFSAARETANARPSAIAMKYDTLGFRAADTRKAPFDVIARHRGGLILTEVFPDKDANPHLEAIQQLLSADALVIFDRKQKASHYPARSRKKLPSIDKRDFMGFATAAELIKFLKEFE